MLLTFMLGVGITLIVAAGLTLIFNAKDYSTGSVLRIAITFGWTLLFAAGVAMFSFANLNTRTATSADLITSVLTALFSVLLSVTLMFVFGEIWINKGKD